MFSTLEMTGLIGPNGTFNTGHSSRRHIQDCYDSMATIYLIPCDRLSKAQPRLALERITLAMT